VARDGRSTLLPGYPGGARRSADDVWADVQLHARRLKDANEPIYTPIDHIRNEIVAVTRHAIVRRSDRPRGRSGTSKVTRGNLETIWHNLQTTG
jgi:hypothetical protein